MLRRNLETAAPNTRQEGARFALYVLTAISLLNYADRYVPASVKTLIKSDLQLSDAQTAFPTTGMVLVYSFFAVIFGWMNDYKVADRRLLLFIGIVIWSFATALAGLARNLSELILLRSIVGVGEAAFSTIAPTMLSDFYPRSDRQVMYGVYYLSLPVGAAIGFGIGAVIGAQYGWRAAFYVCGIPGLIVAASVLRINDPNRGINDEEEHPSSSSWGIEEGGVVASPLQHEKDTAIVEDFRKEKCQTEAKADTESLIISSKRSLNDLKAIVSNPLFMFCVMGYAASAFALGGLAEWYATYLLRYNGASLESAGLVTGAATVVGGVVGNILGSKVADYCETKGVRSAYMLVPGLFCIPSALCCVWAVNTTNNSGMAYLAIFLTQVFAWTQIGPISAVSITCVAPRLRARATGLLILFQHILGDVIVCSDIPASLYYIISCI